MDFGDVDECEKPLVVAHGEVSIGIGENPLIFAFEPLPADGGSQVLDFSGFDRFVSCDVVAHIAPSSSRLAVRSCSSSCPASAARFVSGRVEDKIECLRSSDLPEVVVFRTVPAGVPGLQECGIFASGKTLLAGGGICLHQYQNVDQTPAPRRPSSDTTKTRSCGSECSLPCAVIVLLKYRFASERSQPWPTCQHTPARSMKCTSRPHGNSVGGRSRKPGNASGRALA